jgi:hypothetical protein
MICRQKSQARRGIAIPLIAICIIGLFAFVALAVDLGMLAISRTHAQNAADIAALAGTRQLSNRPGVVNSNLAQAVKTACDAATSNFHRNAQFTLGQIERIDVGQYLYDPVSQQFRVSTWYNAAENPTPPSGSWTAMRVRMTAPQSTYFMRILGVNTMTTYAVATAVYRPRDIAFVLDMTGSMQFASLFNYGSRSHNPDTLIPRFGHYSNSTIQSRLISTTNYSSGAYTYARNNVTIYTPGGPPIIRNFYFDPANLSNPATPAVTVNPANLRNAFHRWNPPESGANSDTYTPPTYDFTGYDAFDTTNTRGPTPAPYNFQYMTDANGITYVGDRWRRADGSINKTDTTWSTSSISTKPATTLIELLGYNVSGSNVRGGTSGTTVITTIDRFRDPIWEQYGYDLDIVAYRAAKGNGPPLNPGTFSTLVPPQDRFKGYSMGPGYWGKTFFIWPPDPRAPVGNPGDAIYVPGDWRRRYFLNRNGILFDPQLDNNPNTSPGTSTGFEGINQVLLNNSANQLTVAGFGTTSNPNWRINYTAVLRWIKSGPQVLPPNLRAGRIVYYTSIPDDVNTSLGTTEQRLDKVFWKEYIDYVLGWNYTNNGYLYGPGDSWSIAATSIYQNNLNTWTGPSNNWPSARPYMCYNDSPNRPRLHFWFGPLSMVGFIAQRYQVGSGANWLPGTCYESQCWQLKAGMNSVVDDLRNNRPNDNFGLVFFAASHHNGIRVPMGQNYTALKNALFYPQSLLGAINSGDTVSEIRPYNLSFSDVISRAEIPNAAGSTDPVTGFSYAFNLLSPSTYLPASTYGTIRGRRGAAKVIIFETDGVPNTVRVFNFQMRGYDSYYVSTTSVYGVGDGGAASMDAAYAVVQQIVKPMATTNASGVDSGLSLPNAPARVYAVAFGDLFDPVNSSTFRATALQFLANVAAYGGTGAMGATTIPDDQIITGTYQQRIDRLRNCMQRIFKSGVSVTLIE